MTPGNFEPSVDPSQQDCQRALAHGLGRAHQWAATNTLDVDNLTYACTHDLRYDPQCEESRGPWLWMLIERRACIHELEARIWEALQSPPDEHSLGQHCQLAMYFSLLGHERFTQWLFELVSGKPISGDLSLGEEELLVAAGAEGFIAAARKRGERLQNTQWDWDDDRFLRIRQAFSPNRSYSKSFIRIGMSPFGGFAPNTHVKR